MLDVRNEININYFMGKRTKADESFPASDRVPISNTLFPLRSLLFGTFPNLVLRNFLSENNASLVMGKMISRLLISSVDHLYP